MICNGWSSKDYFKHYLFECTGGLIAFFAFKLLRITTIRQDTFWDEAIIYLNGILLCLSNWIHSKIYSES
jgi:hypothetical protein